MLRHGGTLVSGIRITNSCWRQAARSRWLWRVGLLPTGLRGGGIWVGTSSQPYHGRASRPHVLDCSVFHPWDSCWCSVRSSSSEVRPGSTARLATTGYRVDVFQAIPRCGNLGTPVQFFLVRRVSGSLSCRLAGVDPSHVAAPEPRDLRRSPQGTAAKWLVEAGLCHPRNDPTFHVEHSVRRPKQTLLRIQRGDDQLALQAGDQLHQQVQAGRVQLGRRIIQQ